MAEPTPRGTVDGGEPWRLEPSMRLRGHALMYEGMPHDDEGRTIEKWNSDSPRTGRAKCECGAMSEVLTTRAARKRWHHEHKVNLVRSGQAR